MGSIAAPDEAPRKKESHALQCLAAGPQNASSASIWMAKSELGLGNDIISRAARLRTATWSNTLTDALAKIHVVRSSDQVTLMPFSTAWEKDVLRRSMAYSTTSARSCVSAGPFRRRYWILSTKMQKRLRQLCCEVEQQRDLSRPISSRASKVLGHRAAIRCASRATRPGLAFGFFRVVCNGM